HTGSYDNEPESFHKMEQFCADAGLRRTAKIHREIYLSDARKTAAENLKTVLRFSAEKITN
ncbi:MAG: GyrI-like domain-containing protein, partial [Sphaerochaetaceae bacterium]